MGEAKGASDVVQFGTFRADFRTGELRRQGVQIKLQGKPLQLLAVLVQHPGELVTRDELRRTLWGDQTFVDFERSLNIAITKLRAALGDSADNPRFVETLPRRGYRFIAPLTVGTEQQTIPAPSDTGAAQAQSPPTKTEAPPAMFEAGPGAAEQRPVRRPTRRRALLIGALSVPAVAAAVFAGIWVAEQRRTGGPPRVESLAVLPWRTCPEMLTRSFWQMPSPTRSSRSWGRSTPYGWSLELRLSVTRESGRRCPTSAESCASMR